MSETPILCPQCGGEMMLADGGNRWCPRCEHFVAVARMPLPVIGQIVSQVNINLTGPLHITLDNSLRRAQEEECKRIRNQLLKR
ncbi:MAG TPA: hypothetical protein PKD55_20205 [Bellilinea sp.]|mgnify:CR=1 FL=1|nr:hypothetical protein [Bellilinea sp.]